MIEQIIKRDGRHGYISRDHFNCPECGAKAEVWSIVTGYLSGKKLQFGQEGRI
ncbi:anaerobic ribonucleoside-triphosphate reductase [Desulfosporosinus meridiei]|uniref:anaerobic ribonucleoside-triphosphate reductase n=1 Tax=Desulfosporosinus meridiei TaxID=79209 RepID=UPI0002314F4C|nr:hypothetical protein [Desulfosporosinus meridiei]